MFFLHQSPTPEIRIYRYKLNLKKVEWQFTLSCKQEKDNYPCLLSYSFSESVGDLIGQFSFTIAGGNNNLFDKILPLDIVEIYEEPNQPVFVGVVSAKSISCSMSGGRINRNISVTGKSISSLIAEFQLILDFKFLASGNRAKDAGVLNQEVIDALASLQKTSGLSIAEYLKKTWELYLKFTGITDSNGNGKAGLSNIAVYNIITQFMGNDFFEVGRTEKIPMPIANTFFNQNVNTALQMWQCILAPPVYEIFSRVNDKGATRIVVREAPFDAEAWDALPIKTINTGLLTNYTLHRSNDEIYTVYLAYLEGSQLNADQYIIIDVADTASKNESAMVLDESKFNLYGLRMCQVNFRGYDVSKDKDNAVRKTMHKYSKRLKAWFSRLDQMYMGNINMINNFAESKKIRCGERVKFLGGEFYVRVVGHSWTYGGTPTISLQVSRGAEYSKGNFTGELKDLGTTRVEFKSEEVV